MVKEKSYEQELLEATGNRKVDKLENLLFKYGADLEILSEQARGRGHMETSNILMEIGLDLNGGMV